MDKRIKALALLSGGLDSTLALWVMRRQGIDIQAIHFSTGFCLTDTTARARRPGDDRPIHGGPSDAFTAADKLGIPVQLVNISDGYLEVLHNPKFGYGKNVNPCVDCRIHMFSIARWLMDEHKADFVFTGEVLGQRPKSQLMRQLKTIAEQSRLEDRLLRPLSALLLPLTLPEREGWVDRAKLFGFHGRSRKPQMALAAEFGIEDYPQPAGGCCFLTDPSYARKVQDLWLNGVKEETKWDDYLLLKVGRHLRIRPDLKVVVGRNKEENAFLENYKRGRVRVEVEGALGPVVLIDGPGGLEREEIAARIAARYCDSGKNGEELNVRLEDAGGTRRVKVKSFSAEEVSRWVIS
jgi:tRNA U34 2-thiouridine synthase MnmA/TrmU